MSEYIEINAELADEGLIIFHTNLKLTAETRPETYTSYAEMEEGSPVAQALAMVEGIGTLEMKGSEIVIASRGDVDWHVIIADVTAALKDFFL